MVTQYTLMANYIGNENSFRVDIFRFNSVIKFNDVGDCEDVVLDIVPAHSLIELNNTAILYGLLNSLGYTVKSPKIFLDSLMDMTLEFYEEVLKYTVKESENNNENWKSMYK